MPVAIVTDSSCDPNPSQAASLGIDVAPTIVRFGAQEYLDGVDLSLEQFYERLDPNGELPTTAPATVESYTAIFKKHADAGKDVVCAVVSAKISQNFANASEAAKPFGASVRVIDSKTLSGGIGLLASGAARLARGGAGAAEIQSAIERWVTTQHGYAVYPDLKFMAKSGRINKAQLVLGTVMHMFPVTRVASNGSIESEATTKSWDQAKEMLASIMSRKLERPATSRVFITHANSADQAEFVAGELRKRLTVPVKELSIFAAGPAIGSNVGPGSLGIFMLEE